MWWGYAKLLGWIFCGDGDGNGYKYFGIRKRSSFLRASMLFALFYLQ